MFIGNSSLLSSGPLSVAVPGELKAYNTAHKKYGKAALVSAEKRNGIIGEPALKESFFNNDTNDVFKEGEILRRPLFADTLQLIAEKGAEEFYSGELGKKFVQDVQQMGGLITEDDLKSYQAHVKPATNGSNATSNVDDAALMYHRIVEALKFAYAKRTYLGDEAFVNLTDIVALMLSRDYANSLRSKISDIETHEPSFYEPATHMNEDKGTAHVNVLASNGDAVSATSTVKQIVSSLFEPFIACV
ncbi:hypothetical protein MRX96_003889 [Rhipicephalus microplus]